MSTVVSTLDHLVVVAATLEQGVAWCEKVLGVRPLKGGEHVRPGTHNHVLALGDQTYLEVIAVNPAATALSCPRWFGMDQSAQRLKTSREPYLATFVARTTDVCASTESLPELGRVWDMQRDELQWKITIRDDGDLVDGGAVPVLIQWPDQVHPTQSMPDSGCRLLRLEIHHPQPEQLEAQWRRIGLGCGERLVIRKTEAGSEPRLVASISTPSGLKTIG